MNLQDYYWYFTGVIPTRICDEIVKTGESFTKEKGLTGGDIKKNPPSEEELENIEKKRKSDVVWLSGYWLYKELHPYINIANEKANWNFQWDWSESCQFTKYNKGQYYDWHCDGWDKPYMREGNNPSNGKIRKLSVISLILLLKVYKWPIIRSCSPISERIPIENKTFVAHIEHIN